MRGTRIREVIFGGSVITERLYIDVKQDLKKKKKKKKNTIVQYIVFI